jgi:membrane-associated phospholipid phosphatase
MSKRKEDKLAEPEQHSDKRPVQTRRQFIGTIGGVAAIGLASGSVGFSPAGFCAEVDAAEVNVVEVGPVSDRKRGKEAFQLRVDAALSQKNIPLPDHPTNGDEELYATRIGNFSKGLPHNPLGEVVLASYNELIAALTSARAADFEAITLGGGGKLVNPQSSYAFEMAGADSHHIGMPAPPALASAEEADEMVELYWHAIIRDIPFTTYDTDPLAIQAAADLSALSDFRGPKVTGQVTTATLFRGDTPGDLAGPYLSQFLLQSFPFGAIPIAPRIRTAVPAVDYMVSYSAWLGIENGGPPPPNQLDSTPRFIRNGRDLAAYVHSDFSFQAYLTACNYLLSIGAHLDAGNPYGNYKTQSAFSTFGAPDILSLVAAVAAPALDAAWYQKWLVHRRLRPEEFGGRIHNLKTSAANYPVHADVLNSAALSKIFSANGTYLLPQAYPEGCPLHTSYPAGHAVVAGACVTVLKAFFDESFVIPNPLVAGPDGLSVQPFTGADLTLGGELNKLAANIAIGRNIAGVHWRSDGIEGLKLGEAVAISILTDRRKCYNEDFAGYSLTKFDGTTITV